MKTLFTTLLIALSFLNSNSAMSYECCFVDPASKASQAIDGFMESRLNTAEEDIVHKEILSSETFASTKTTILAALVSPIVGAVSLFEDGYTISDFADEVRQTDFKYKFQVQFNRGHEFCTVDLKVLVKMRYMTTDCTARTVTVKQKYAPVCN